MFLFAPLQINDHKELVKARNWKLVDMKIANNPMTAKLKELNAYPKYIPDLSYSGSKVS